MQWANESGSCFSNGWHSRTCWRDGKRIALETCRACSAVESLLPHLHFNQCKETNRMASAAWRNLCSICDVIDAISEHVLTGSYHMKYTVQPKLQSCLESIKFWHCNCWRKIVSHRGCVLGRVSSVDDTMQINLSSNYFSASMVTYVQLSAQKVVFLQNIAKVK